MPPPIASPTGFTDGSDNSGTLTELPGCGVGCGFIAMGIVLGAFGLSFLTYAAQAHFNPVPISHSLYEFIYLFTAPLGAFIGAIVAFIYWRFIPKGIWLFVLVLAVLLCFGGVAYSCFNPISDPKDPSFIVL